MMTMPTFSADEQDGPDTVAAESDAKPSPLDETTIEALRKLEAMDTKTLLTLIRVISHLLESRDA